MAIAFLFLGSREESIGELAMAPFQFRFLKRQSTWIPLAMAGALSALDLSRSDKSLEKGGLKRSFGPEDALFASATSYNAGLWEEAVFRGWLMPVVREYYGSDLVANLSVAALFSLAHISAENPIPWPQFALGYYLGQVTLDNSWSIAEAIFVHAWWDVIVISAAYSLEKTTGRSRPMVMLPPLQIYF